jgi:sulfoxide reductase heme-binding subunit YedZ
MPVWTCVATTEPTRALRPGSPAFFGVTKAMVWMLCLAPAAVMLLGLFQQAGFTLGANPVEELLHRCGDWGLRLLLVTLTITPLRRWTGRGWLIRYRRLLGLFAFFYVLMHFIIYVWLDRQLDAAGIIEDIAKRPYITIGVAALLMLIPLAVTSTRGMMRRLGRRWQKLHRLVYPATALGVWHFWWQVKADILEPMIYAILLTLLLGVRWSYRRVSKT